MICSKLTSKNTCEGSTSISIQSFHVLNGTILESNKSETIRTLEGSWKPQVASSYRISRHKVPLRIYYTISENPSVERGVVNRISQSGSLLFESFIFLKYLRVKPLFCRVNSFPVHPSTHPSHPSSHYSKDYSSISIEQRRANL